MGVLAISALWWEALISLNAPFLRTIAMFYHCIGIVFRFGIVKIHIGYSSICLSPGDEFNIQAGIVEFFDERILSGLSYQYPFAWRRTGKDGQNLQRRWVITIGIKCQNQQRPQLIFADASSLPIACAESAHLVFLTTPRTLILGQSRVRISLM